MQFVISVIEILLMFLIYNILFNNKLFKGIGIIIVTSVVSVVLFNTFKDFYESNHLISIFTIILLNSMVFSKIYSKSLVLLLSELVFSMTVVGVFELGITFIIQLLFFGRNLDAYSYLFFLIVIMGIVILFLHNYLKLKSIDFNEIFYKNEMINIIILNVFILLMFIKLIFFNEVLKASFIIQVSILMVILISINIYFLKYSLRADRERKRKEINEAINPLLNELVENFKEKEHEYKNYLTTISGIVQVTSEENVKSEIQKYLDNIVEWKGNLSKLLYIDNMVIKAIIYNTIIKCEELSINFKYNTCKKLVNMSLDEAELTIVLSNLLNNAVEAAILSDSKEIDLNIFEEENNIIIDIKNSTKNFKSETLNNMFNKGYSTKGKNRGYGLSNVKKIITKHNGKIQLALDSDIFNLVISLPKKN